MTENESMFFFREQKGRIFAGNLTIMLDNEPEIDEGFAGAVGLDNRFSVSPSSIRAMPRGRSFPIMILS